MKANPGGEIDPKDAVGRDRLVETIWDSLEQLSIIIVAERRIGKTTVAKYMRANRRGDHRTGSLLPGYHDQPASTD